MYVRTLVIVPSWLGTQIVGADPFSCFADSPFGCGCCLSYHALCPRQEQGILAAILVDEDNGDDDEVIAEPEPQKGVSERTE
jgi:hypothetical protein